MLSADDLQVGRTYRTVIEDSDVEGEFLSVLERIEYWPEDDSSPGSVKELHFANGVALRTFGNCAFEEVEGTPMVQEVGDV